MLTRDQGILSAVYKIAVSTRARQKKNTMKYPYDCSTGEMDVEISEMLTRGAISVL